MSYKKRKRNFVIFIVLVMLLCAAYIIYFNFPSDERVDRRLAELIEEINMDEPQMMDEFTREDSLSAEKGRMLVYHISLLDYDIHDTSVNISDTTLFGRSLFLKTDTVLFKEITREDMIENMRDNFRFNFAYKNRCDVKNIYYDKNGNYITSATITPDDYLLSMKEESNRKYQNTRNTE